MSQRQGPPPIIVEIDRAMQSNDMARAAALAQQALDGGLVHPILYSLRAHAHRVAGRLDAALADLQAAQRLNPRSANIRASLADVLNALDRYEAARAEADEAIALDRKLVAAWYQRGLANRMLNALDAASAAFAEAARRDPKLAPAHARLAEIAATQGRVAQARESAARALALSPGDTTALLALIRADLTEKDFAAAEPRIRALLDDPKLAAVHRIAALGFLADIRDTQDRTQEAFAAYVEAGSAWRVLTEPRLQGRESAAAQTVRLTREIAALAPGAWRAAGPLAKTALDDSRGIAFILGFPRTGTTLLAQILSVDPSVAVLEEKPVFAKAAADFLAVEGGIARLAALSDAEIARYRDDVWQRIRDSGVATRGKLVLDQNALNTAYLPVIVRLFPEAPIVFTLRDPRDAVFGAFRRRFGANIFTLELASPQGARAFYAAMMDLAQACRDRLGLTTLDLRNEDLIEDFDRETQRLCDAVGLAFSPAMRDFANRDRTVGTISAQQVRRGISRDGIGQWRRYAAQLGPILPALAPYVARFGYRAD